MRCNLGYTELFFSRHCIYPLPSGGSSFAERVALKKGLIQEYTHFSRDHYITRQRNVSFHLPALIHHSQRDHIQPAGSGITRLGGFGRGELACFHRQELAQTLCSEMHVTYGTLFGWNFKAKLEHRFISVAQNLRQISSRRQLGAEGGGTLQAFTVSESYQPFS